MRENAFQASLIRTIKNLLPGCIILKNDPNYIQGIPDLIILSGITWAALEVKNKENAKHRPNQDFYISTMSKMSFATFVYPENVQQVLESMINHFERINNGNISIEEYDSIVKYNNDLYGFLKDNNYREVVIN